jgi:hypothetical protein
MAYLDPKGEGDSSMPGNRRSCSNARSDASRDPCDMAKAGLPEPQSPDDENGTSAGKAFVTGATPCTSIITRPVHPPGCGAIPSEGMQGDEWGA